MPTQKMVRHLHTSPYAVKAFMRKAELMGVVTHVSSLLKIFSPSFWLLWLVQSVFSVASVCECHKIMISPHYSFCCTICECHKIIVGPQCLLCSISLCISFMFESLLWLRCLILINLKVYSAAIYKMLSKWCSPVFWLREHETVASGQCCFSHLTLASLLPLLIIIISN